MQEAVCAAQITPSSVCSYPTYTPPPPLPPKRGHAAREEVLPPRRRTFHEECDEVLRIIHEGSTQSSQSSANPTAPVVETSSALGGGISGKGNRHFGDKTHDIADFMTPSTIHEKYRTILDEVEHLNRLLGVMAEEHAEVEGELRAKLLQAQVTLRDCDAALLHKDCELLHLRGTVEGLTMRLEACRHHTHLEERSAAHEKGVRNDEGTNNNNKKRMNSSSIKSTSVSEEEVVKNNSNVRAEIITASATLCGGSRSNSNSMEMTAADGATYSSSYNNNNSSSANATSTRLAQSALKWVTFLLGKYFYCSSSKYNKKLTHLLSILNELQEYNTKIDVDASLVRSLCTQASNSLVEVVKVATCKSHRDDDPRDSGGVPQTSPGREESLLQLISYLETERDTLKQNVRVMVEENIQLLRRIKVLEAESAQTTASPTRVEQLEVRNAMLMAERDRQSAFIADLKRQVHRLRMERAALQEELVREKTSKQRNDNVMGSLSFDIRGKGDNE